MTISGALSNAMSGLRAASRASGVVSSNIANSLTPGYGRRELDLSANGSSTYGGVRIVGITRISDPGLLADRRVAEAQFGNAQSSANFASRFEALVGGPEDATSLTSRLADFESSLISAASRPDSPERLTAAAFRAGDLAATLNRASDGLQQMREDADKTINSQVDRLNTALQGVQELNSRITATIVQSGDVSSFLDHRQALIDEINTIVPITEVPRDNGQVALYSAGGAVLLDGRAAELAFSPTHTIVPHMTQANGLLSGLTLNGNPIRTDSITGAVRGGSLGAQFEIRDELAVEAQAKLDTIAEDLVMRFQDPSVDPSLAVGQAGLFTDAGAALTTGNEIGLSGRLTVNAAVDPKQGGESWRMRDGVAAATPGNAGDATLLHTMKSALSTDLAPPNLSLGGGLMSSFDLSSNLLSDIGASRLRFDQSLSFASAGLSTLKQMELADGVDTDSEMQNLMLIEQAYGANARMIETVDEMIQILMRL